jgi:hypothetical protein
MWKYRFDQPLYQVVDQDDGDKYFKKYGHGKRNLS